jgi:hypothetical protein
MGAHYSALKNVGLAEKFGSWTLSYVKSIEKYLEFEHRIGTG